MFNTARVMLVLLLVSLTGISAALAADLEQRPTHENVVTGVVQYIDLEKGEIVVDDMRYAVTPETMVRKHRRDSAAADVLRVGDRVRLHLKDTSTQGMRQPIGLYAIDAMSR